MTIKLITPPLARMLAGRLLRANEANAIVLTTQELHACKEAVLCGFVGDQLRRRLMVLWVTHGRACIKVEDPKYRRPQYDALDAMLPK